MILQQSDRFGEYEVVRFLGRGGMGEVYLMKHVLLGVVHAVKLLYRQKGGESQEAQRRFLREARLAAGVRHPNLVDIYDAGYEPRTGMPYIAMEYLGGGNLADRLKEHGCYTFAEAMEFMRPLAAALKTLAKAGIAHCDIKPENIMFAEDGTLKLSDFGVSRSVRLNDEANRDMASGTPAYMSPEQLTDAAKVGPRSDIYSLGVVLWEMLAGKTPHQGDTLEAILARAMRLETLPDLREAVPGTPPCVAKLVAEMTAPDVNKRPASAAEVLSLAEDARIMSDPVLRKRRTLKRSGFICALTAFALAIAGWIWLPGVLAAHRTKRENAFWSAAANDTSAYAWFQKPYVDGNSATCPVHMLCLCGFGVGPMDVNGDEITYLSIVSASFYKIRAMNFYYGEVGRFCEGGTNLLANYNLVIPVALPKGGTSPLFPESDEELLLDWVANGGTLFIPLGTPDNASGILAKTGLRIDKVATSCDVEDIAGCIVSPETLKQVAPPGRFKSVCLAHLSGNDSGAWHPVYWLDGADVSGAIVCFRKWGEGTIIVAGASIAGPGGAPDLSAQAYAFWEKLLHAPLNASRSGSDDFLLCDGREIGILEATGQIEPISPTGQGRSILAPSAGAYRNEIQNLLPEMIRAAEALGRFGLLNADGETDVCPRIVLRPVESTSHEYIWYRFLNWWNGKPYYEFGGMQLPRDYVPIPMKSDSDIPLRIVANAVRVVIDFAESKCYRSLLHSKSLHRRDTFSLFAPPEVLEYGFWPEYILGTLAKAEVLREIDSQETTIRELEDSALSDVAKHLGVSLEVASRFFGGDDYSRRLRILASFHRVASLFERVERDHPGAKTRFVQRYIRFCTGYSKKETNNIQDDKDTMAGYQYTNADMAALFSEVCGGADMKQYFREARIAIANGEGGGE